MNETKNKKISFQKFNIETLEFDSKFKIQNSKFPINSIYILHYATRTPAPIVEHTVFETMNFPFTEEGFDFTIISVNAS